MYTLNTGLNPIQFKTIPVKVRKESWPSCGFSVDMSMTGVFPGPDEWYYTISA